MHLLNGGTCIWKLLATQTLNKIQRYCHLQLHADTWQLQLHADMHLGKFVYCNLPVIEIPESLNASLTDA